MSDTALPPDVEAALLAIARRAYPTPKGQATSIGSAPLEDLREAYRLGLAAGREDGELLDWLNRGFYAIDRCGPGGPWTVRSYWGMGDWVESGTANTLRAAIRAAKEADRG